MPDLPKKESLTVEFKSDRRCLPDRELIAAVVCLTNAEGGVLYIGVEDDGAVSGLHARHTNTTTLAAMIANRTVPSLQVRVTNQSVSGCRVAAIDVPKSRNIIATSDGLVVRRRVGSNGRPECVPFYPHEVPSREADLGLLDYTARPIESLQAGDLSAVELARLRETISQFGGEARLLELSDDELMGALGLIHGGHPTIAGILLLGKEPLLREHLPTHEVAFQVLDGTEVKVNQYRRTPPRRVPSLSTSSSLASWNPTAKAGADPIL